MSLPASPRHRWGLDDGGDVGYLDLGDAVLLVPGGTQALRSKLLRTVTKADWDVARTGFGDDDLSNQ